MHEQQLFIQTEHNLFRSGLDCWLAEVRQYTAKYNLFVFLDLNSITLIVILSLTCPVFVSKANSINNVQKSIESMSSYYYLQTIHTHRLYT